MLKKPNPIFAAMMLIPLLGLTAVGLVVFAWPVLVAAAVIYILARLLSLFRRRPKFS